MRVRGGGDAAARSLLIAVAIMQIFSGAHRATLHPVNRDAVAVACCVIAVALLAPGVVAWLVQKRPGKVDRTT